MTPAPFAQLPLPIDLWAARVRERAPLPGDVLELSAEEWVELARLRGSRRRPRLLFGRKVVVVNTNFNKENHQ